MKFHVVPRARGEKEAGRAAPRLPSSCLFVLLLLLFFLHIYIYTSLQKQTDGKQEGWRTVMVKPGLQRLQSTVPRLPIQQPQSLLATVKLGLLGLQSFLVTAKSELAELFGELHDLIQLAFLAQRKWHHQHSRNSRSRKNC